MTAAELTLLHMEMPDMRVSAAAPDRDRAITAKAAHDRLRQIQSTGSGIEQRRRPAKNPPGLPVILPTREELRQQREYINRMTAPSPSVYRGGGGTMAA